MVVKCDFVALQYVCTVHICDESIYLYAYGPNILKRQKCVVCVERAGVLPG